VIFLWFAFVAFVAFVLILETIFVIPQILYLKFKIAVVEILSNNKYYKQMKKIINCKQQTFLQNVKYALATE
jgi:hypothetical protein